VRPIIGVSERLSACSGKADLPSCHFGDYTVRGALIFAEVQAFATFVYESDSSTATNEK
jgi:hypothetical protein